MSRPADQGRRLIPPGLTGVKHVTDERRHHAAKITIYLDEAELLALDQTVIELRRVYGLKVDRSRFVREALRGCSARKIAARLTGGAA